MLPFWRCTLRWQPRKGGRQHLHKTRRSVFPMDCIALRIGCTRLAPISDILEMELQCGCSLYRSCLSGDVHWGGNLEKMGDNIYAKRDAKFSHWIALGSCCTRLAPISDILEMELQCGFSLYGSCLSGDVHWGGNLEKWATTFTQSATQGFPIGWHCASFVHVWS